MAEINQIESMYSKDYREVFEDIANLMFCTELDLKKGVNRRINQRAIESDPVLIDGKLYAYQAKYYDASTKLSEHKRDLIKCIEGAASRKVTDLFLYINKDLPAKDPNTGEKAGYIREIEFVARQNSVDLHWHTLSMMEAILVMPKYTHIKNLYFGHGNIKGYYDYVVNLYEKPNTGNTLLGEESLAELYMQPSYCKSYDETGDVEQLLEEFISKEDHGVVWLVGEPGHGKTSMCIKAVADYRNMKRYLQTKGVFWFRLNPQGIPGMVKPKMLALEKVFSWGRITDNRSNMIEPGEIEGSLVFLDGFDELKSSLEEHGISSNQFYEQVNQLALEYKMHVVVTSRTQALEQDEFYTESQLRRGDVEIICNLSDGEVLKNNVMLLSPLTKEKQTAWINELISLRENKGIDTSDLRNYKHTFQALQENEDIAGLLKVPILLRMIVQNCFEPSSDNRIVICRELFDKTLLRQGLGNQRERLHSIYREIAFRIFAFDDDCAEIYKDELISTTYSDAWLYQYYLHTPGDRTGQGKANVYCVAFHHRFFYHYFLSEFLYERLSAVKDEMSGESFLKCLWPRHLDKGVLDNLRLMQELNGVESACVFSAIEKTDCYFVDYICSEQGAHINMHEKSNNVFWNAVSIINHITHGNVKYSKRIIELMSQLDVEDICLRNADLSDADLSKANLRYADLGNASLSNSNLSNANLSSVNLRNGMLQSAVIKDADLRYADLSGAYLRNADLSSTDFSYANLIGADLSYANLSASDIRNARLEGTLFSGADLRSALVHKEQYEYLEKQDVKNLDTVIVISDKKPIIKLPKITDSMEFKELCRDILSLKFNVTPVSAFGRDMGWDYSFEKNGNKYIVVCWCFINEDTSHLMMDRLCDSISEMEKSYDSKFDTIIIMTTLNANDTLSEKVKDIGITQFTLQIWFWENLKKIICSNDSLLNTYYPSFASLQKFIEKENLDMLQAYPHSGLDDLIKFVEMHDTDRRKAQELLELLWMLYLVDSNRVKKVEILASSNEKPTDDIDYKSKESNEKTSSFTKDRISKEPQESQEESKDEPEQYKPEPSDLENATKLVLEDFKKWWEEESDRMGLTFSIDKNPIRQKGGSQYGYDVGLNTEYGGLKYWLRFECKNYTSNMSENKQDKTTSLNVRSYAYNLLEFFMECESEVNMRWVLICPFGDLQNDFPEKLFEHWNKKHTFIKIYAIMENGPTITCKDFLSVNKDAYKKIYNKDYDGGKTKEKVFKELYDEIVGIDDVREAALKRLQKYVFWDDFGGHKGLLPVPDRTSQIALKQIISFLRRKKESDDNERKKILFVIGEYGTGKSWLCYRAIEQIVLHPNDFPFMPFYLRLKDLSQKKDLEDKTQYKDIMTDTLKVFSEKYDEWAGECVRKALQPVFFLDGFDEVFSGLSVTDKKIHFLLRIISELKDWYEKYENERDIKKHTKPLFVITSRESDFEIGMKSKEFQYQMDQAEIIELEMCSVEEVREAWNKLEEEDHIDRSWIFKLEQNSAFLNIIRRPVFYRLCSDALKDDTFKQKVDLASVDEVDVLDMLFEYELQNYAHGERIDKNEIRRVIYECAVICSKEKRSQIVYEGKGVNQIIHVGMVKIQKDQEKEGTCWVSFEHNIVREYLTAKFLSQCLIDCPSEEIEEPMRTTFVQTLQELSLTPEALKFLLLCIEKKSPRDKGKRYKELLKKWLCNRSIKSLDSRLPARLLEILLQPGYTLSGENDERLDLAGLHASDLCLWNCGMRHVNLSQAVLKNWQIINMEMDDVDLRKANMEGLRLAPDKPISSFCQWKDTKEWHVAALHNNGQLMQYSFPNDSWKKYSAEILSQTCVNDGVFHFSNELMLYSVKKLYDIKENELYQIRSNYELERIVTDAGLCGFITKQGDNYQVVVFQGDLTPVAYPLGNIEQSKLILTKKGQVLFVKDGMIKLIRQNGEMRQLCKWESSYECFTAPLILSENAYIYAKSDDSLIRIAFDEEMHEVKSLRQVLHIEGDLENMRELRVLNESALVAVGKNELYILSLEKINDKETVKSRRLKTAISIMNSLLEDEGGRNRVKDNNAYELLSTSMR